MSPSLSNLRLSAVIHCPFPTFTVFFLHLWWLVTVTLGWTVGFQQVTRLNPFLDLIKPPDWSENCLVNFSPTLAQKDLSEFFYKEYLTIKLLLLELIRVKTRCSIIQYKWGQRKDSNPSWYINTSRTNSLWKSGSCFACLDLGVSKCKMRKLDSWDVRTLSGLTFLKHCHQFIRSL